MKKRLVGARLSPVNRLPPPRRWRLVVDRASTHRVDARSGRLVLRRVEPERTRGGRAKSLRSCRGRGRRAATRWDMARSHPAGEKARPARREVRRDGFKTPWCGRQRALECCQTRRRSIRGRSEIRERRTAFVGYGRGFISADGPGNWRSARRFRGWQATLKASRWLQTHLCSQDRRFGQTIRAATDGGTTWESRPPFLRRDSEPTSGTTGSRITWEFKRLASRTFSADRDTVYAGVADGQFKSTTAGGVARVVGASRYRTG
jgi:hypothetical protein